MAVDNVQNRSSEDVIETITNGGISSLDRFRFSSLDRFPHTLFRQLPQTQ